MENKAKFTKKKIDIRTFTMVAVLILLWIGFTLLTSDGFSNLGSSFIAPRNLSNLVRQMAIVGIIGSSMALVIVTGGIDLSAGSVVGFIGCVAAALQVFYNASTLITVVVCLILSVLIYLIQGSIIAYAGLAPFIVTLGGQLIFRGLVLMVTKGATIAPLNESFLVFGQAYITIAVSFIIGLLACAALLFQELSKRKGKVKHGTSTESLQQMLLRWFLFAAIIMGAVLIMNSYRGIPVPVIIMFALMTLLTIITERTVFGRSIYAIGGNLDAAYYSGINVKKNLVKVYMLHGVLVGIAGMLLAARLNAGSTTSGKDMELDAIAAAVIGGTSMSGGIGKPSGAILGALIMASIDNGMSMMNLDAYWQYIVKGIILVGAVWFDIYTNSKKKK